MANLQRLRVLLRGGPLDGVETGCLIQCDTMERSHPELPGTVCIYEKTTDRWGDEKPSQVVYQLLTSHQYAAHPPDGD